MIAAQLRRRAQVLEIGIHRVASRDLALRSLEPRGTVTDAPADNAKDDTRPDSRQQLTRHCY
jgi:hypothetical protein